MMPALALSVLLYSVGLSAVCGLSAIIGRDRPPVVTAAVVVLFAAAALRAAADAIALANGQPSSELAVHVGYLLTSIAIIPMVFSAVGADSGRCTSACLALGCAVLAVVSLRMEQTLVPA